MDCPYCSSVNPDDSKYCHKCGQSICPEEKISDSITETIQTVIKGLRQGEDFGKRYRIIKEIGSGGMGVVYQAEDKKLKRIVALKTFSPQALLREKDRNRFIREAQAAAALNHPNICTIYEIDEAEGLSFIAMEYIEGRTLKDKVKIKPVALKECLNIGIQIVEGLKQAHERGIVHRDIKSSNIMITEKGLAKITDFGLAKLSGSSVITKEGMTVGTVAYMSPEQARGEDIDLRTDIWSLGVVLYENIAGQLPFKGSHDQAVLLSILNENPQAITALRSGIPFEFERIVAKCLEKDVGYRYQSTSDLLTDLKRLERDTVLEKTHVVKSTLRGKPQRKKDFQKVGWAALGALLIFIPALMYYLFIRSPDLGLQSSAELKLRPFTSESGLPVFPSWSPDGKWIVYASDKAGNLDIWKKPFDGGEATPITSGPYNESQPDWSPDGRSIAFSSDQNGGGIHLIPASGGTPFLRTYFGANPTWSPNGESIAFDWNGDIYLVSYRTGEPRRVVSGTSATPHTVWTRDGENLIYWNRTKGDIFVYSISEDRSQPLGLIPSGEEVSGLALSRNGRVLYISRGPFGANKNLWEVSFNPRKRKQVGNPNPISITTTEDVQCALSPDCNKLAYSVFQLERHLWIFPLDPTTGMINSSKEPERLTFSSKNNYYPSCSQDGIKLVWTSHLTSQGVISFKNLQKGEERKLTKEWGENAREVGASLSPDGRQVCFSTTISGSYEVWRMPSLDSIGIPLTNTTNPIRDTITAWSPDGERIAFYSNRLGSWDIWCVELDNSEKPQPLTQWETNEMYPAWSPDGQLISFRTDREGNADIWIMGFDGSDPRPYVKHPAVEGWGAWSPDGRWFYFTSNRSGAFNVWKMPASGGEPRQVTDFRAASHQLPDVALLTKFAVTPTSLILPLESRRGDIYILENLR